MSASLIRQGVQVTVVTSSANEEGPQHFGQKLVHLRAQMLGIIPVTRIDEMRHEALLQSNLSLLALMISQQRSGIKIDLVHSVGWEAALASGLICQMTGSPLVCSMEDVIWEREPWLADPKLAYPRYVERWLIRHCHRLICPDHYMRDKIQDLFLVREEDMTVIPPFPEPMRHADEGVTMTQGREQRILFAGPLGPRSGVDDLLKACSQLITRRAHHLQIILVTSADCFHGLRVRKMIRRFQLAEHVLFVHQSAQRGPEREIFRQASLLVMPGRAEFVGNLVLAAMQNGVPVVAANCGALAEMVEDGVNGLKFSLGNCKNLVEAMETLLFDRQLHRQMATGAYQKARSWPEVGPLLLKVYREACGPPLRLERKGGEIGDLFLPKPRGGRTT